MNTNLEKFLRWLEDKTNFLLIDLEANSPWDWNFELSELETIQIGYIVFDPQFEILKKWSIFIKPTNNPILSEFIKELTGITQDQVNAWVSYKEWLGQMMDLFREYHCWHILSYGKYDMKQLYSDCQINGIEYPFFEWEIWHSDRHINIKNALASRLNIKEKWMEKLLDYLWLDLEWKHHDWEDDCHNILKIVKSQFAEK